MKSDSQHGWTVPVTAIKLLLTHLSVISMPIEAF